MTDTNLLRIPPMDSEFEVIKALFTELYNAPEIPFPKERMSINAPATPGVYVISDAGGKVLHVGRSNTAKYGLAQRLSDHLYGRSSFVNRLLSGNGSILRWGATFRYLVVLDGRNRALLEAYATGCLCPAHIG